MTKVCFWPVSAKKRFIHLTKIGLKKNLLKDLEIKKNKKALKKFMTHIFDHVLI